MKKLIRLKPLNPFFFGTNKTFSDETLHDVTSSYFPQQTHLLGMLRFFLLQSGGHVKLRRRGRWVKNSDFKKAFDLVGGFDKNNSKQQEEKFGIIQSISPVFIISTKDGSIEDFHFVAPKDTGLDTKIVELKGISQIANKKRDKQYQILNYNPKIGVVNALTTSSFWGNYSNDTIAKRGYDQKITDEYLKELKLKPFFDVFKDVSQVGIRRDRETKTVQADDDGSFYNKTSYMFKENKFEFAFIVDIDKEFEEKDGFVYLGADRSTFRLKVEDYSEELKALYPSLSDNSNKQVALSDIEVENFDDIEFMLNEDYIAHAYMKRVIEKQQRASSKYSKSRQQCFIPKGSVIYFKNDFDSSSLEKKFGYNSLLTKEK